MGKDFKIGLVSGLILAIVGLVWIATRPSLSPEARLRSSQAAAREGPARPQVVPPARESTAPIPAPSREQPLSGPDAASPQQAGAATPLTQSPTLRPVSPAASVDSHNRLPDMTIYERSEKIKTTKFHIVRRDETLSAIARQYYGSPEKWRAILEANKDRIKDANRIQPGTKLTIPELN